MEEPYEQLETVKVEVKKLIVKEYEIKAKTARLDELNVLLNMDSKERDDTEKRSMIDSNYVCSML